MGLDLRISTLLQSELCSVCKEIDLQCVADGRLLFKSFYLNPKHQHCILCDGLLHFLRMLFGTCCVEYRFLRVVFGNILLGRISVSPPTGAFSDSTLHLPPTEIRSRNQAITEP